MQSAGRKNLTIFWGVTGTLQSLFAFTFQSLLVSNPGTQRDGGTVQNGKYKRSGAKRCSRKILWESPRSEEKCMEKYIRNCTVRML